MSVPSNQLLDLGPGVGQIQWSMRFEVLNSALESIDFIHPLACDGISANTTGASKRQLQGFTVTDKDLRRLDPFAHRIKPWAAFEDGSLWPCGVFVFTDASNQVGTYTSVLKSVLLDQDFILNQGLRASFGLQPHGLIRPAVIELLQGAGIVDFTVPADNNAVVGQPPAWPAGTSRLKILEELCTLAGWLPPYFDNTGRCVIKPPPDVINDPPDHIYSARRVLYDSVVENENLLNAPNLYLVIGSGGQDGDISAYAYVDPALPFSVENRGFEIVSVTRAQAIASSAQAQRMADTLAAGAGKGYKNVQFTGNPDPRHDLFQTVDWKGTVYREISWNLKFGPAGPHTHSLTLGGFSNAG